MHTGQKIRLIRLQSGFSQENMAEMLKLSRPAYGNIERGITALTDSRLQQIAAIFKLKPTDILEFGEPKANFFDQCSGLVGINSYNTQHNHYDQREAQHELKVAQLEIQNLRLEAEKYRLERDNALLQLRLATQQNAL
jgi:XRE family transcriptional regulator, regulator of sulfur utilization